MRKWYEDKKAVATIVIALMLGIVLIFLLMKIDKESHPVTDTVENSQGIYQDLDEIQMDAGRNEEIEKEGSLDEDAEQESLHTDVEELQEDNSSSEENNPWKGPDVGRTEEGLPDYSQLDPNEFEVAPEVAEGNKYLEAMPDEFIGALGDSGVRAHGIQPFDGIFIETMKDTECSNIATILLENTTDSMISYLILTVRAGERMLTFEASAIPAGGIVLVQEKTAEQYEDVLIRYDEIHTAAEAEDGMFSDKIELDETDDQGIQVSNISPEDIPVLRLFYKMKSDNVYIGGITYSVTIKDIPAGSSQTVYPSHYVSGMAEILMAKEYDE